MFDSITSLILANAKLAWSLLALVSAIILLSQQSVRFWFVDFWVRFPLIGTIARLSKVNKTSDSGWFLAEDKLCSIYKPYVSAISKTTFNQRIEYMRITGDLGRTPMPMKLKLLLFILVIAEGLGFSYILGTWMAREGSANTHNLLMVAIVFVIGVILVLITHSAGHQYYRTRLLRACSAISAHDKTNNEKDFKGVTLESNQHSDANSPNHERRISRITNEKGDKGSYSWSWVAGIFIVIIFVLSTVMRIYNLEAELTTQVAQQAQAVESNPFADTLPSDVVAPQVQADKKAVEDIAKSTNIEGMSAILMLGFIFVVTQIVGFGAGYQYGFAGKETYKEAGGSTALKFWGQHDGAYADTQGFSTYDSYWKNFQPLVDLVNSRLKDLQERLIRKAGYNPTLSKTFYDYLKKEEERVAAHQVWQDAKTPLKANEVTEDLGNLDQLKTPEPVVQVILPINSESIKSIDDIKADIAALTEKSAQIEYFQQLPENIKAELAPWLKQRKVDEAAKKVDINELF